eukprot:jgi/Tetstr1/424827/TSEL_015330.t1
MRSASTLKKKWDLVKKEVTRWDANYKQSESYNPDKRDYCMSSASKSKRNDKGMLYVWLLPSAANLADAVAKNLGDEVKLGRKPALAAATGEDSNGRQDVHEKNLPFGDNGGFRQRFARQPTGSGGAAERPDLLELAQSGRVGAKSVSAEDDYLAVPELLQRAESGYEAVRPVSRVPGLFPLSTDLMNEYLKQDDRRLPAQEEYLWMSCFGAHMAALFVALDELLPYVPSSNQDFTPYLARARNHAEAIDKAFRFRLAFLRKLNEIKRVHGDQGVLDVLRAQHFQPASEHMGSAIFGDLMRDYERRVFEATC